jgi:hypothetical protein
VRGQNASIGEVDVYSNAKCTHVIGVAGQSQVGLQFHVLGGNGVHRLEFSMSIGSVMQLYKAYKTTRESIGKVSGSSALKVLAISYRVDALITDYTKAKILASVASGGAAKRAVSNQLRVIMNELEALVNTSPAVPKFGKDMTVAYVTDALEVSNTRQAANNELNRIYVEQFSGALPTASGGKAYWPTTRHSLQRLRDAALAVAKSLRGTAFSMQRDINTVVGGQDTLRDIRNDKFSTPADVNAMDADFNGFRSSEIDMKAVQKRYYAVAEFFQLKADGYDNRIEVGNVLWSLEK